METWGRHIILVNFPDTEVTETKVTTESLGDIQHDHLSLQLGLDSRIFGKWAPSMPPTMSTGPRLET